MKKKNLLVIMMAAMLSVGLLSCGSSDNDEGGMGSGLKGWYTNLNEVAKQSDFNKINEAIQNEEVLSSYNIGGYKYTYVASRDLFIDGSGMYNDGNAHFGYLRFSIQSCISAIRIVDDTTLLSYIAYLYEDGTRSDDAVYSFYAGLIFGNMTYYGTPIYYTYAKVDNKIVVSNGDIYTIVDGGLVKDGSSGRWSKYDPTKKY